MAGYAPRRTFTQAQLDAMAAITAGKPTKSAKIRALGAAGYERAEIAAYLGISYQHVHGVLGGTPLRSAGDVPAEEVKDAGVSDGKKLSGLTEFDTEGGLRIPPAAVAALRRSSNMPPVWVVVGVFVIIFGREGGLRHAQEIAKRYDDGTSWSEELIAERRAEARREGEEAAHDGA
jgi:hypothetical protein